MPASQYALYNFSAAGSATANAAETVIGTARTVSSSYPGCVFAIEWSFDFTSGAGTTAVTYRIRRDSLTGTVVLVTPAIPLAAATISPHISLAATDSIAGEVAGQAYVLTAIQTAGAGAGQATNVFSKVTVAE